MKKLHNSRLSIDERGDYVIHIAVCDDDLPTTELIERLILDNQKYFSEKVDVTIFYSGESFSKAIQSGCPFEIVFMDIEMEGIDGIEVGHILRSDDENEIVQLIYISSHEEYHLQLFDVQPSGFIKKPIEVEIFNNKLISIIQKAIRRQLKGRSNSIMVHQKGKEVLVHLRDIMYLESRKRKVILYTRDGEIEYYSTLNKEERRFPDRNFIRIHQSYIVNFYFIKEICNKKVIFVNLKELPISEKNSASVRKNYLKFRGDLIV